VTHAARPPLVAVAGLPGTGTTTLCRLLSARLSLPHVYAGQFFRQMAKEKSMDLVQFGEYAEQHREVDTELDRRMIDVARANREGIRDVESVLQQNRHREASEAKRYREFYGFDPNDPRHYDLVIASHDKTPDEIADLVVARLFP
jgi:cytidylate kinase